MMTTLKLIAGSVLVLIATEVICEVCNEKIIERKIASDSEFIKVLKEIQKSSLQNVCYSVLFHFNAVIELNLDQSFNIPSDVLLQGNNTTIKCNISPPYNHAGIINVNNVENFIINGISFANCPSTFIRFENVSSISIFECSFRYVGIKLPMYSYMWYYC